MAEIFDSVSGFLLGDPEKSVLNNLPSDEEIQRALSEMILSASGWRKIFCLSKKEESKEPEIGDANKVLAAHIGDVFSDYLLNTPSIEKKEIIIGIDSRPTGVQIAECICRVCLGKGLAVKYLCVTAAPEIMAFSKASGGFLYVSASHNPIGHNGIKFGSSDGGVLDGSESAKLIEAFRETIRKGNCSNRAQIFLEAASKEQLLSLWDKTTTNKQEAIRSYEVLIREIVSNETEKKLQDDFFNLFSNAAANLKNAKNPIAVLADFNGSARAVSIDRSIFEKNHIYLFSMNDTVGSIVHRIVPEGESLSFCANELTRLRNSGQNPEEKSVFIAYVPDCDGDRGNIVFWDDTQKKARALEAQEVFSLSVIAELTYLAYQGKIQPNKNGSAIPKTAVVINDPTSMRIDDICSCFGVQVARAEVGEANVVSLARKLRAEGSIVRILGEGSNGGTITHPSAVRDPLTTVFALLKMIILRSDEKRKGLFYIWCELSEQLNSFKENFTLTDIIETLPKYTTTSVYEKEALMSINSTDHRQLKSNFQTVFLREWEAKKEILFSNWGISSWKAISYNGINEKFDIDDFAKSGSGGLKIVFNTNDKNPHSFIWMRGSGTEPVFRILCDVKGENKPLESYLLQWLRTMVLEADSKIR